MFKVYSTSGTILVSSFLMRGAGARTSNKPELFNGVVMEEDEDTTIQPERTSVWKSQNPELFYSLVAQDKARRILSLTNSKKALEEKGIPPCYWVYIDANCSHSVPGYMLGCLFTVEKYVLRVIDNFSTAQVFHISPEHGDHVSLTVDIRDDKTIMFYLSDSLNQGDYLEMLASILRGIRDGV